MNRRNHETIFRRKTDISDGRLSGRKELRTACAAEPAFLIGKEKLFAAVKIASKRRLLCYIRKLQKSMNLFLYILIRVSLTECLIAGAVFFVVVNNTTGL